MTINCHCFWIKLVPVWAINRTGSKNFFFVYLTFALCPIFLQLKHFRPPVFAKQAFVFFTFGLIARSLVEFKPRLNSFLLWAVRYCSRIAANSLRLRGFRSIKWTDNFPEQELINCSFTINSTTLLKLLSTSDNFTHWVKYFLKHTINWSRFSKPSGLASLKRWQYPCSA